MAIEYYTIECNDCGWHGVEDDLVKHNTGYRSRTGKMVVAYTCPGCGGDDIADVPRSTSILPDGYHMDYFAG